MHLSEPMTVDEALNNPIWKKSMDQELKAQIDKNTWELVIPPKNINIVRSKWVFHSKKDDKKFIICPKSHLVAQGFTQTFGVDYDETYAPVIWMTSLDYMCHSSLQQLAHSSNGCRCSLFKCYTRRSDLYAKATRIFPR